MRILKRGTRNRRLLFEKLEFRAVPAAGIQIISVPPYGVDGFVVGKVTGIPAAQYANYRVAPLIQIEGSGWWSKPTFVSPTVSIMSDGTFRADVATGGIDNRATIFYVGLIPAGVTPPLAAGAERVPAGLPAIASGSVERFSRTIQFAGWLWGVKEAPVGVGPGGNRFSNLPSDVFVDSNGLHLGVTFHDGAWWSTEVVLLDRLGHGTYAFQTNTAFDKLDPNVTVGAFTWDSYGDDTSGADPHREIDSEDSRWGNASDPTTSQMVVQPYSVPGNLHRYTVPDLGGNPALTRLIQWQPDHIQFTALKGHYDPTNYPPASVIDQYVYSHNPSIGHFVPTEGRANFRINAWVNGGGGPSNGVPVHVVFTNFAFLPLAAPAVAGPTAAGVSRGGTVSLNGGSVIIVNDPDGDSGTESVALSVTSGTITLSTTDVTVSSGATGTNAITIRGTLANLNKALATLQYSAPTTGSSATLTTIANDGAADSLPHRTVITMANAAPTMTAPASASVVHGGQLNFTGGAAIAVNDVDGGTSQASVALIVSSGTITLSTAGVTVVNGASGTNAVTIRGALANLNQALASIQYLAPIAGSLATLTAIANDGTANSTPLSVVITLTNVAPTVMGPTTASIGYGGTLNFTAGERISVNDLDGGSSNESVALSVTSGTLTVSTAGVTVTSGASGTSSVTITGTLANLNKSLATLRFVASTTGTSATLSTTAYDGSASSAALMTLITLTTAPAVAGPTMTSVLRGRTLSFNGENLISVADFDGDSGTESVTLTVTSGALLLSTSGVTVTSGASGTGTVTIRGMLPHLNQALATLRYVGSVSGSLATLTTIANDGSLSSSPLMTEITLAGLWYNVWNRLDVNADTFVSPIDAVLVINLLNSNLGGQVPPTAPLGPPFYDTSNDDAVSPIDAVLVINWMNAFPSQSEGEGPSISRGVAADNFFNELDKHSEVAEDIITLIAAATNDATWLPKRRSRGLENWNFGWPNCVR